MYSINTSEQERGDTKVFEQSTACHHGTVTLAADRKLRRTRAMALRSREVDDLSEHSDSGRKPGGLDLSNSAGAVRALYLYILHRRPTTRFAADVGQLGMARSACLACQVSVRLEPRSNGRPGRGNAIGPENGGESIICLSSLVSVLAFGQELYTKNPANAESVRRGLRATNVSPIRQCGVARVIPAAPQFS